MDQNEQPRKRSRPSKMGGTNMHRTLKAETTRPPETTIKADQQRFDAFRYVFNQERPYEALDMDTPADQYRSSSRTLPMPLQYRNISVVWKFGA